MRAILAVCLVVLLVPVVLPVGNASATDFPLAPLFGNVPWGPTYRNYVQTLREAGWPSSFCDWLLAQESLMEARFLLSELPSYLSGEPFQQPGEWLTGTEGFETPQDYRLAIAATMKVYKSAHQEAADLHYYFENNPEVTYSVSILARYYDSYPGFLREYIREQFESVYQEYLDTLWLNPEGQFILWLEEQGLIPILEMGSVVGYVCLHDKSDYSGITVSIDEWETTTASDGYFVFHEIPQGHYGVVATKAGYSSAEIASVDVQESKTTFLPAVTLGLPLPADVDRDGKVDVLDLAVVATHFNSSSSGSGVADINADGLVDVYDLVVIGINFGTAPLWPGRPIVL